MKQLTKRPAAFLAFIVFLFSCEENNEEPCKGNEACTLEWVTVSVGLKDSNDNPVVLDSWTTTNLFTNGSFVSLEGMLEGYYVVVSDAQYEQTNYAGTIYRFQGYIEGKEVYDGVFKVGKNCCHIFLIEGETEVTIEL